MLKFHKNTKIDKLMEKDISLNQDSILHQFDTRHPTKY